MNESTVSEFNVENRFSDCVFMKLHSTPVQAEEWINPSSLSTVQGSNISTVQSPNILGSVFADLTITPAQAEGWINWINPSSLSLPLVLVPNPPRTDLVDLKLTIRFGQQEIKIGSLGSVWFGLRRGELKLTLKTGMIPLEKMGLTAQFETEYELEEQHEKGMESGATLGVSTGISISISPSIATKDTSKESSKVKSKVFQVCTTGTEENPKWVFESKIHKSGLEGQLTEAPLGIVEVWTSPCNFEAIFTVSRQRDIVLTEGSLLLTKDIVRNKSAHLEREFYLRYIASKLQPCLSRIEGAL